MIDEEAIYNYDVFISSRNTDLDNKWANWLIKEFENWSVPKELIKKGFQKRIGRVFKDSEESSENININTEKALIHSKYLVVICSKNSKKSERIENEIKIFKELGRSERIVALLIDGEPYEAFPNELTFIEENGTIKKIEPLAADVRNKTDQKEKETKKIALLKILSCILACNFDDLRQREKRREKRKFRNKFIILLCILVVLSLATILIWDYNRLKITYYNNFVYQYGLPKGIGKLQKSMYLKRAVTYIFEEQRRVLKQVKRVNSFGRLRDDENNFNISVWIPETDVSGNVKRIICKDHNNKIVMIREYSSDLKIIEFQNEFNLPFVSDGSSIVRYEVEYNDKGYITNEFYYRDSWNTFVSDIDGFYGKRYEVDNNGMIITEYGINMEGKNIINRNGVFKIKLYYDRLYSIIKKEFLDSENNLFYNTHKDYGYSYIEKEYDKYGNLIKKSFFDNNHNRIIPLNSFYSSVYYELDSFGNISCANYLDSKDEYIHFSYSKCYFKYDELGNNIYTYFQNMSNQNAYHTNGYSICSIKYDNNDNIIEKIYYDANTNISFMKDGYSIKRIEYDNNFNKISVSYYGNSTNKILNNYNYHKKLVMYNDHNRITNISYYDINDDKINAYVYSHEYLGYESYASHLIEYDKKGNIIENAYLDENGNYKNISSGYAICRYSYNDIGLPTEETYYDSNENKTVYLNSKKWFYGFHKLTRDYDDNGNVIKILFYDVNDNLYLADGKFEYWIFDNAKCAGLIYEYNNSTRSKIIYLGTNQKPINAAKGISIIKFENVYIDEVKQIIDKDIKCNSFQKESYYDVNENPILVYGYHNNYAGDNNGEKISIFTGINNELVINTNEAYGCAYLIYKYRNPFNNKDELTYYDTNNNNTLNSFGYYKRINTFDDKGINIISREYYDIYNKPTFLADRFYKVEFIYDSFGNLIYEKHYDTNNNMISDSVDKYALSIREYDNNNRMIKCSFYDLNNNLTESRFGYAKITIDYYSNGKSYTNYYNKNNAIIK